jgi:DNA-binding NarL/FixJ family response regulator
MALAMTRTEPIRVLLVDDHPAPREAVRLRLTTLARFQVVGEASDPDEALATLGATHPDVAVIDISFGKKLSDMGGLTLTRKLRERHRETRILIWSMHGDADHVAQARAAGAHGYILKSCKVEEIVKAIEVVAGGGRYYSSEVEQGSMPKPTLTAREREVLTLVKDAKSSREIARELKIEFRTVESHRRNIMDKLGAKNVVEMITIAYRLGLIDFME